LQGAAGSVRDSALVREPLGPSAVALRPLVAPDAPDLSGPAGFGLAGAVGGALILGLLRVGIWYLLYSLVMRPIRSI
jgi:hypothetical protein